MISEERLFQFRRHINLLNSAVEARDTKQINEVLKNIELTEDDFMEMPVELVAKFGAISSKARAISSGTYDEEDINRAISEETMHKKLGIYYDINEKEPENPEEQQLKDNNQKKNLLVMARIYAFLGGIFGLLSIFILYLVIYRALLWLNWFPEWFSISISILVSFFSGGRYYLNHIIINIFAGILSYGILLLLLQTTIATWGYILIGLISYVILRITDNKAKFYLISSKKQHNKDGNNEP